MGISYGERKKFIDHKQINDVTSKYVSFNWIIVIDMMHVIRAISDGENDSSIFCYL